ncbi:hypothetical protein CP968_09480 [Streptomyces subrutilus]|uniref:Uncharacterized protein n=1 Tax=Streptomyces subrutilus TaxID=36818 RepID=A0A5P2UHN4_9ACTN|nr:hypothetical protein CP968_09480 [Streptomyces subrutilus]
MAHVLRHAPDRIALALLDRLGRSDPAARTYLCRDEWLPASAVTLLLRHGTDSDRHYVARNPRVVGRPLPGLPGPVRYAKHRTPPELAALLRAELGRDPADGPLTTPEVTGLLRRHGARRPRTALEVLRLPHALDPALLAAEHARRPLPPGAVEALLLVADLPPHTVRALLAPSAAPREEPAWHRPAVRAVRMGRLTHEELVGCVTPARRALLLCDLPARPGLRWTLPELAGLRTAALRALAPLGDDPRLWAELLRRAPGFPGPLPDLVAAVVAGPRGPAAPVPAAPVPAGPVPPDGALPRAVRRLAPAAVEPVGEVERELALASLAVPMETVEEDIRWVRDCLDRGLLTGTDVVRHKLPACWALDEDHWLGEVDHPDRHDRPEAVLAARAEADRLFDLALGTDPDAWWEAARTLPDFAGTLPHLLLRVTDGGSVPKPS